MDPASASGLAVGITSLAFDVFDNSVKREVCVYFVAASVTNGSQVFKFFSAMVDMPKECEQFRLQLMIEYNRLLAWGEAVGLIHVPQGSHVATSLGTNAVELCGIVSRIGWLLGEFRDMNTRWKNELRLPQEHDQTAVEKDHLSIDMAKEVSSLATAYERSKDTHQQRSGVARIRNWMHRRVENASDIVTHPLRVRWVMVDKVAFEGLLKDLHFLTDRMHELTETHRQNRIQEMTIKTYREMVVARNGINELKNLLEAVTELLKAKKNHMDGISQHENDEMLRDLLQLKEINGISNQLLSKAQNAGDSDIEKDFHDLIVVQQYDASTLSNVLMYSKDENTGGSTTPYRPRGVLQQNGTAVEIWVEWRVIDDGEKKTHRESKLRTITLAQMLHNEKPRHLYSPRCIGYIDDVESNNRTGWIFKMPNGANSDTTLKTLHSMLGQCQYRPALSQRISLAWKLAISLSYMHTTGWLHKGIHSGNIVFSFDQDRFDTEAPILSGFEYSRPQSSKTTTRSLEPKWDIYRWPRIQNEVPKVTNSRKTYDIYSLGLVLLEIAYWKPLHKIMCLKRWPMASSQDAKIRGWLLEEDARPPFKDSNPLSELRDVTGDKYWKATRRCLVAHGDMGMQVEEIFDQLQDPSDEIQLQNTFMEFVVEELKSILI
ncbi:hypothetical protein FSARC_11379 [Fusarium sarcochroum]|uniref:Protein kinase domain-containing protein n=1 Tax=Fusarium sarcochroum TaxID=1208366 RepID=A0A8H4X0W4_9HYPO|nr:hypothetical protein FSARC_11379 [Fusarium sarcochroum]